MSPDPRLEGNGHQLVGATNGPAGALRTSRMIERTRIVGSRSLQGVRSTLGRVTPWQWLLVIILVAWGLTMARMSLDAHYGLATSPYDLGIYQQGVWLMSQFETPFITLRGVHLFGDHTSFILVVLLPLYWIFPATGTLLTAQAFAIAAGAIPVFLYARQRVGGEGAALALSVVYLLHPTLSWKTLHAFHPEAFLPVLVGFALYGALMRHWRVYWVFVALTLLVKEDSFLIIVALGLWVALQRDRRIGLATISISIVYTLVAFFVILNHFAGTPSMYSDRIPFGGPFGLARTAVTDPAALLGHMTSGARPWYLLQMTAPFAWVFLRLPGVAAIAAPVLIANVIVGDNPQHDIGHQYSLVVVAVLAMGAVHAIGAIAKNRRAIIAGVGVVAVATSYLWSALPLARESLAHLSPTHPQAVAAREAIAIVPDDAAVAAPWALTPHLSRRTHIWSLPNPFHTRLYGVGDPTRFGGPIDPPEGTRLPETDILEYVVMGPATPWRLPQHVEAWERERWAFELIFSNDYYEVYRRVAGGAG
jgi:uncharacterized membrane protein